MLESLKNQVGRGSVAFNKKQHEIQECKASIESQIEVCDEYYRGPYIGFWHDAGWATNYENCSEVTKRIRTRDLITILIVYDDKHISEDIVKYIKTLSDNLSIFYSGVLAIIAIQTEDSLPVSSFSSKNVEIVQYSASYSKSEIWLSLIRKATTPYVLVGKSLHTFVGQWANLERSIRLLGSK